MRLSLSGPLCLVGLAGIRISCALAICALTASAQSSVFEVALIKPSALPLEKGVYHVGLDMDSSHGICRCSYCSLQGMIGYAYGVKPYQIIGPDWTTSETFALDARMPKGTSTETTLMMLQSLLKERFEMNLRREERPFATYSLSVATAGARLKKTDAAAVSETIGSTQIVAPAMSMDALAKRLSSRAGRPVINVTGLDGNYEVKLTWLPTGADGSPTDSDLFRALREDLGLELRPSKTSLPVFVIESALKIPIAN